MKNPVKGLSITLYPIKKPKIDPICLIHNKKMSEHLCLYCCLCWKSLTSEECNICPDGKKEDVCKPCAAQEKKSLDKQP